MIKSCPRSLVVVFVLFAFALPNRAPAETNSIAGSKKFGCLRGPSSNRLVSLSGPSTGRILSFESGLKGVNQDIKKAKRALTKQSSRGGIIKALKKLNKLQSLRSGIISCSDGTFSPSVGTNCADPFIGEGTECDDGNPCTTGDACYQGVCKGVAVTTSSLSCGQGSCASAVEQCLYGVFVPCFSGELGSEICNGLDDDCDGSADNVSECLPATPTPTPTPSPTPTPVNCAAAPTPFNCIAAFESLGNSNLNPPGCPCQQNGNCSGDCVCGLPCEFAQCNSGTCVTDQSSNSYGSCSGVCLNGAFNVCVGGSVSAGGICVEGNKRKLSAACCTCTSDENCENTCVSGICT